MTRPAELEEFGLAIAEDEDYDTVSGFVMSELGRIPKTNDRVRIDGGSLVVIKMDGRRVDRIKFEPEVTEDEQ